MSDIRSCCTDPVLVCEDDFFDSLTKKYFTFLITSDTLPEQVEGYGFRQHITELCGEIVEKKR